MPADRGWGRSNKIGMFRIFLGARNWVSFMVLFVNHFLSFFVHQKQISDFWDLNRDQNLACNRRVTPPPPHHLRQRPKILYTILPAGTLCELPRLFGGNSHSDAACNFCPDQLGCVRLPRPVRVHRLPRKLGLCAAAPIVRVECGRGVG